MDHSEIGPYLGGHWATSRVPTSNSASPMHFRGHRATSRVLEQTQPHPCASEVIGLHPRFPPQTQPHPRTSPVGTESLGPSPARPAAQRADGETPSLPTCRYRPSGPLGPAATSEVGRFLRKRHSGEQYRDAALSMAGTLDNQCHGGGPLGDRSLPKTPIDSALLCPGPGLHGDSRTMKFEVRVPDGL
jgi:hypothetical protein